MRKKNHEATDLFGRLLWLCPSDNMGIRYMLLAVLDGMSCEEFDRRFTTEEGLADPRMDSWWEAAYERHRKEFEKWEFIYKAHYGEDFDWGSVQ